MKTEEIKARHPLFNEEAVGTLCSILALLDKNKTVKL